MIMNQSRIDETAKSIIEDVVRLQVIFNCDLGNRDEAMTKLFTINRQARSLLSGKAGSAPPPSGKVMVSNLRLSQLRLNLESGDLAKAIQGLTTDDLGRLLEDLELSMKTVNNALFNMLRKMEDGDGVAKPAA